MQPISSPHPGIFIVFEGITAAGKTTLAKKVVELLNAQNPATGGYSHDYNQTRYISELRDGTTYGDHVREALLGGEPLDPMTEATTILGAKNELIKNIIRPGVARGEILICDRFTRSFMAFQGGLHGIDHETLLQLLKLTKTDVVPDLELFFTVSEEEQAKRRGVPRDHFEVEELADKRSQMLGFFEKAKESLPPYHSKTIDASDPFDDVLERVMAEIYRVLKFHRVSGQSFNTRHSIAPQTLLEGSPIEELIDPPLQGEIAA